MSRSFTVVMLGGALNPSPLQAQLRMPPLCLPMGRHGSLAGAWLATIATTEGCAHIRIVVNTEEDAQAILGWRTSVMGPARIGDASRSFPSRRHGEALAI